MSYEEAGPLVPMSRLLAAVVLLTLSACGSDPSEPAPADPVPVVNEQSPVADDWCAGHDLPESKCTVCNPELTAGFQAAGDWCAEHGFPESACPTCNPQTPPGEDSAIDWCAEHALPESQCTKCNPGLVEAYKASGDWCAGHGFPESVCPTCNPATPPPGVVSQPFAFGTRIRFRTPEIEQASGLAMERVRPARIDTDVACTARIVFDRKSDNSDIVLIELKPAG